MEDNLTVCRLKVENSNFSLKEEFDSYAEEILEDNERVFETVGSLSDSSMYSNDRSFSKYRSLCRVIDFTKIADMTHLITHYGAISNKVLSSCTDEKEAGKMLIRKSYTDLYLSKYHLDSIDHSLDETNPHPIGFRDKSKWYSYASRFLTNAFMGANLQIDRLSNKLYFTDSSNDRVFIENFTEASFVSFLEIVLHTSDIFDKQIDWTADLLNKLVESMLNNEEFSTELIRNDIIQLNDCYVKDGIFLKGKYPYIPRFYINHSVYNVVETRTPSKVVPELDEFLMHLSDYDRDTAKVLLSRMSSFLMNSEDLKSSASNTINILYGASGQNGKSLFLSIFKKIFNTENIMYAGLRDFNNRNYSLPQMCQSLLVVDEDASDLQLDSDAASAIKQFTQGQTMYVRSIYEKVKAYRPRAMVVACTNHMPTAVDKSEGFNRRFSIFTQTSKIINKEHSRSDEWFKAIKSDDAAQYLLELLVLAHLDNMKRGCLMPISDRMKEINEDFVEKNDTAVMYVRAVGLKEIVGKPARLVKECYEKWCEDNGVVALKSKFNTTLETKFNLKSRLISVKKLTIDESDLRANGFPESMKQIKSWVHIDEDVTNKYLEIYRSEMSNDLDSKCFYAIETDQSDSSLSEEILETLEESDEIANATSDEINRKIAILMNEESEDRTSRVIKKVESRLTSLYKTEAKTVEDMSKDELDRYLAIGQYDKSLAAALKDPRRQVLIYQEKKEMKE